MIIARTIDDIRSGVARARSHAEARTIGLVPTLGGLHEAHFELIRAAKRDCDFVVVSIFLNPTQFDRGEDLGSYPADIEADLAACADLGVEAVFAPSTDVMYPDKSLTRMTVDSLAQSLCGTSRPEHFAGVCTVVAKLFNIVQPDRAYFGEKDFQQLTIIRRMVDDLNFPIRIVPCPTVREPDGLAMSSRNAYLTASQRAQAQTLSGALDLAGRMILARTGSSAEVIQAVLRHLADNAPDGRVDYVQIVDPRTLQDVQNTDSPVLVALAVHLGQARLIDNVLVDAAKPDH